MILLFLLSYEGSKNSINGYRFEYIARVLSAAMSGQARELEKTAKSKGVEIILPTDVVVADAFAADANTKVGNGPSKCALGVVR